MFSDNRYILPARQPYTSFYNNARNSWACRPFRAFDKSVIQLELNLITRVLAEIIVFLHRPAQSTDRLGVFTLPVSYVHRIFIFDKNLLSQMHMVDLVWEIVKICEKYIVVIIACIRTRVLSSLSHELRGIFLIFLLIPYTTPKASALKTKLTWTN